MLKDSVKKVRESLVRVVVTSVAGKTGSGTGFFVSPQTICTCLHVAIMSDGMNTEKAITLVKDDLPAVSKIFESRVSKIEIFKEDGTSYGRAHLKSFEVANDMAVLELESGQSPSVANVDFGHTATLGEKVAFCGFPKINNSPDPLSYSLMLNEGIVSGLPVNGIGGFPAYEHMQINAVSLGGFSGAPVFLEENGVIVALINGSSNHNIRTTVLESTPRQVLKGGVAQIPMGIAYATVLSRVRALFGK